MREYWFVLILLVLVGFCHPKPIPEGLGVNIHFFKPEYNKTDMIHDAGWSKVRMDFLWAHVERSKGRYYWDDLDLLVEDLREKQISILFILDYGNALYTGDNKLPPVSVEARQAYIQFVLAGMRRYGGLGIMWELWNEPNVKQFWGDIDQYSEWASIVGKAIKSAMPNETLIGPCMAGMHKDFLYEALEKHKLLEVFDYFSWHPYRRDSPDAIKKDHEEIKLLIEALRPKHKHVGIVWSEWGYSDISAWCDLDCQGRYLPRMYLSSLGHEIDTVIWYDFHDDGTNSTYIEHHFGTVYHQYYPDRNPPFDPKPAYVAARHFFDTLRGFERVSFDYHGWKFEEFSLQLKHADGRSAVAVWAESSQPATITVTGLPGGSCFECSDYLGTRCPTVCSSHKGHLTVKGSWNPIYLVQKT